MAAGEAFGGKPASAQQAVLLYGFQRILRAARREAAARAQQRRDAPLIEADEQAG
jgi:hypothetical protein